MAMLRAVAKAMMKCRRCQRCRMYATTGGRSALGRRPCWAASSASGVSGSSGVTSPDVANSSPSWSWPGALMRLSLLTLCLLLAGVAPGGTAFSCRL